MELTGILDFYGPVVAILNWSQSGQKENTLFAMVYESHIPIPITIPNFKNLSPSAWFYELVPW